MIDRARASALAVVLVVALPIPGCGNRELPPTAQLLVDVDTDAPLARPPGEPPRSDVPAGLFDRLRVEIVSATDGSPACDDCLRDFTVDAGQLDAERTSFGVLAPAGRSDLVARVRLFRSLEPAPEPPAPGTIDRSFVLPPIVADSVTEVTAFLPLDAVGAGSNGDAPSSVAAGRAFRHALHDGVVPRGCATAARTGEACVLGGAYWMTSADQSLTIDGTAVPERVVVLAPFFVDTREVTVADLRASGLATSADPVRGKGDPTDCTYTDAPGPNESLPVDCVSWTLAERFCEARGSTLPTEAQLEYLASSLHGRPYAWGFDTPACSDAVFARWVGPQTNLEATALTECVGLGAGPAVAGSGRRDVLSFGGASVVDLSGNVSEWARDTYQALDGPCWGPGLRADPLCAQPSKAGDLGHVFRGGSWRGAVIGLRAQTARGAGAAPIHDEIDDVGFRCARQP